MKKLAIITTHPIQYNAPLFRLLAEREKVSIKVYYTWGQAKDQIFDPDFGVYRRWDIPLLDGYDYEFSKNNSSRPGSNHFFGIINPDIIKQLKRWEPDAVLVYGWAFYAHLKIMRYFKGKLPVLFRGDSTNIDEPKGFNIKKIFRRFFLIWVYKHIDKALYVGLKNKEYFEKHNVSVEKLVFAPHAIDNKRFQHIPYCDNKVSAWRKEMLIDEDNIVFLFAGKFHSKKDPLTLIKAFLKINDQNCHLVLAGDGLLEKEMKKIASNYPNVHFLTFQNQSKMPLLYHLCDVFVLPSVGPGETWGLSINEAMAAGKPILVSDKAGCAVDLIIPNENGYIFQGGDCNDLSEKLNLFIKRKSDLKQMGEKSSQIINDWNIAKLAEIIETSLSFSFC